MVRGLWPGVLLGLLAVGFLSLALLALVGMAGLLVGLSSSPPPQPPVAQTQPTAVVVIIPGAAKEETLSVTAPADLTLLAALPLPTAIAQPTPAPQPTLSPALPPLLAAPEPLPTGERSGSQVITYGDLFQSVGQQTGIDWRLLASLAYRESRMDPVALGRDGDMGLMQILPATWDEFAPQMAATHPFDPRQNVQVSAAYLVYLQEYLSKLGTNDRRWVLAAYNWGPDRVRRLLAAGGRWEDLPAPQQRYVMDILYTAFGAE